MAGNKEVENEFDEFVIFCFEHGGTLRNHKAFGELSQNLKTKISGIEKRLLTMRALDGLYCQLCGEPLSEHLVTERGGHCQPARQ
jgi:hypothetical protein